MEHQRLELARRAGAELLVLEVDVMGKRHSRKRVRRALPSLLLQRAWFPRLYGNVPGEAALEMTLQGSALMVAAPAARLAFAGDFALTVDGRSAAP